MLGACLLLHLGELLWALHGLRLARKTCGEANNGYVGRLYQESCSSRACLHSIRIQYSLGLLREFPAFARAFERKAIRESLTMLQAGGINVFLVVPNASENEFESLPDSLSVL